MKSFALGHIGREELNIPLTTTNEVPASSYYILVEENFK